MCQAAALHSIQPKKLPFTEAQGGRLGHLLRVLGGARIQNLRKGTVWLQACGWEEPWVAQRLHGLVGPTPEPTLPW